MNIPEGLFYTKTHEWARRDGRETCVGITDHAQSELSDVVFIELPKAGRLVKQEDPTAVIESVKAAYDIFAPVSGKVIRVNPEIEKDPALVNKDPYGKGWLFVIEGAEEGDFKHLMDKGSYEVFLKR
ncbi:MAG: glycine cleavage system protein GcvH [Candidatus Omnitrophica bacterium]|nr:glycine cleavage system protein GcvH [Candidatus Omnitrophota bacterium]